MFFPTGVGSSSSSLESPQLCRQFTFSEIQVATQNLDESLVVGRGGFGKVYKGTITDGANVLTVAIKRLDSTSSQGALEFWAEVKMLSKLRHCHLVSLIGYCNDSEEMILVYEYMPHGTLEDHLHKYQTSLPWVQRLKICIGAARGLDYLHTGTNITHGVIHRDVKSSNILLHDSWEAKLSDFGLSRICIKNQASTHVSTLVKGTFGYLDPEYFYTGKLSRKSDVYAFGVVLFEVLCGKRAVDASIDEEQWSLARWAHNSIKEGKLKQIIDTDIRETISTKCLKDFARLADRCLHSHPKQRPTMAEIVAGLESVLALQEKANKTMHDRGMTIFGRRVPMFVFSSNDKNLVEERRNSNSLKLFSDVVGDEIRIQYQFDYDTICAATDNFSDANIILQSAFASMYQGVLENGQAIGIARPYSSPACQRFGDVLSLLVQLQHENLLKLIGYYIKEGTPFFVFELAANGSLDCLICDPKTVLGWNERYKIILGVARVLLYLHKNAPLQIIHADVRPENILLDESLEPKLSDFRYARHLINETDCIDVDMAHWTSEYTAPEYKLHGCLSTKSDVFSFGMLILKTISGYRPYYGVPAANENFLLYALANWWTGTYENIVDPGIDADSSSIRRFIHIGLLCAQENAIDRPTMEDVNGMLLSSSFLTLPVPKSPESPQIIEEQSACTNGQEVISINYDSKTAEEFLLEVEPR